MLDRKSLFMQPENSNKRHLIVEVPQECFNTTHDVKMDMNKILLCGIFALIWCVNEILSIKVYENVSETHQPPFTIDTSSKSMQEPLTTSTSEPIKLFLPAQSQTNNFNPNPTTADKIVKAQILVAESQKLHSYNNMLAKLKENTTKTNNNNERKKQQVLQIPALLSPLTTTDPKATNSSKRQTDDLDSDGNRGFVPSQELGSFDSTEGFVPHAFHQPKTVSYLPPTYIPPTYLPPKPMKHDTNYGFAFGEPRLPVSAPNGMQAFEHDFEGLKAKYPELNDLVSNYPIMEDIMKQKLAEKFQQSFQARQKPPTSSFTGGNSNKFKYGNNEQNNDFQANVKFPTNSNENSNNNEYSSGYTKSKDRPYFFDTENIRWNLRMKHPDENKSTPETPYPIPAGEFYQEPKFPTSIYNYDDKNNTYSGHVHPTDSKPKTAASPWKKVLHLITAFLPVGILISALTPNVINIANVPNKNYPIRQRSLNGKPELSIAESGALIDLLDERIRNDYAEDPECDERQFCEMSRKGNGSKASTVEKIFWRLAHSTPEQVAEASGMKKIFKAVKTDTCAQFKCKDYQDETSDEDYTKEKRKKLIRMENDSQNRDESIIQRKSSTLQRQKRARNKLFAYK